MTSLTRRLFLGTPLSALAATTTVDAVYPTHPPDLVKEMVTVAHGNVKRVKELVESRPSLAKAAYDWGYGDWETALGAASHVGNREIAEYLMKNGAPPTIFSATMLGQLDVVKAIIAAQPGIQRHAGPHGITLLAHARFGGKPAEGVLRYLESLGDAGGEPPAAITPEEISQLTGTYRFGSGDSDRFEVITNRGQLQIRRTGGIARGLVHRGNHAFHPIGSTAVRVTFTKEGDAMLLTLHDAGLILTGRRD